MTRAIVVFAALKPQKITDAQKNEFLELAASAGFEVVQTYAFMRDRVVNSTFIGEGQLQKVIDSIQAFDAEVVLFDNTLTGLQQKNLHNQTGKNWIDRFSLILDIFASRATTHEGKLQVSLAQTKYEATKLVRAWTHLERQKGGIGLRSGAGEKQIELDRRMLDDKIKRLEKSIKKVKMQRSIQRRARDRNGMFQISIVGYTNAGKSTLFNYLTKANVLQEDKLFATLDTTIRKLWLTQINRSVTISDTVGFVRNLPHDLVDAFKATLDETVHADLLLHVIDIASEGAFERISEVNKVLESLGAKAPVLLVWNKSDLVKDKSTLNEPNSIYISAQTGQGIDNLKDAIAGQFKHIKPQQLNH